MNTKCRENSFFSPQLVDYLGSRFDVRVTSVLVHISVRSIGIYPLILTVTDSGKVYYLTRGKQRVWKVQCVYGVVPLVILYVCVLWMTTYEVVPSCS